MVESAPDLDEVKSLRLTLAHDWLTGLRGGEKCLDALCRQFPEAELLTLLHRPGSTSSAIERRTIRTSFLQRIPGIFSTYRYFLPLYPRAVAGLRPDPHSELVLSFSHVAVHGLPVRPDVPHVCYCFTPARYVWDLRRTYFPERGPTFSGRLRGLTVDRLREHLLDRFQHWDRAASARVTHYLTSSATVAARIRTHYGRDSLVISPPVDTEFYSPAKITREDYYLCASALVPYKRLDLAIEACRRLGKRLVIVGAGPERSRLARLCGPDQVLLGWRSDAELRTHYRTCRALLFPGPEDFGIVPLEAQACGCPVLALGQGGATETVRAPTTAAPGTGLFFAEPTVEALCDALSRFEADPTLCDPALARIQAERFAQPRFVARMLAFLAEVRRASGLKPAAE